LASKTTKKVFSGSREKAEVEPVVLPLAEGEIEARGVVSGFTTMAFLEGIQSEEGGDNLKAIHGYLKESFTKDDFKKYMKIVNDPENGYEISDLVEHATYLLEQRSDRSLAESSD